MNSINLLYDFRFLIYNNMKCGIYYVTLNILKSLLKRSDVNIYLYIANEDISRIVSMLQTLNINISSNRFIKSDENMKHIDVFLSSSEHAPECIKSRGLICSTILHDVIPLVLPEYKDGKKGWFGALLKSHNKNDYYFSNSE